MRTRGTFGGVRALRSEKSLGSDSVYRVLGKDLAFIGFRVI